MCVFGSVYEGYIVGAVLVHCLCVRVCVCELSRELSKLE